MAQPTENSGFLSRWSRRKLLVRQGVEPAEPEPALVVADAPAAAAVAAPEPPLQAAPQPVAPPAPTLADVAALTRDSDFSRFVASGVDSSVKNAALKKLFTDPHFNLMDGLDTYIDDYGKPDPLPAGMLRQMAQSQFLGLFADDKPADDDSTDPTTALAAPDAISLAQATPDEDAALRLQPHHAAGPASAAESPEPNPRRQC